jgi:spore coat polysaccharide biosynthesis predicted glycosyltransferase SpsG
MRTALAALAHVETVKAVDILLSPVNPAQPDASLLRPDQTLTTHSAVPDIVPLLSHAEVVLASYGHLGYEALALGRPVCLIGQKRFQAAYAERLQQAGLAVAAGLVEALQPAALAAALRETFAASGRIAAMARRHIDTRGLQRTADLILDTYAHAVGMQALIGKKAI